MGFDDSLLGSARIRIRPDMDGFGRDVDDSVGRAMRSAAKVAAGAFVVGMGAAVVGVTKAMKATSDLNESANAVRVTFGESASAIADLGKTSAKALGLSTAEFNGLAVRFSNFATTVAGSGGDVAKVMKDLTGRAADFASVMNLDVAEAAELFQSGLAGETEPLRRYGIDLSAAAVEAYALSKGIGDGTGELSEQEKVLARYGLLMQGTAKTAGDFANTQGGVANQTRIFKSQLENLKAVGGEAFTPLAEKVMPELNARLTEMTDGLTKNMPAIKQDMAEFGVSIGEATGKLAEKWPEIQAQIVAVAAAVQSNWPEIVETAKTFGVALERVGAMTKTLFDAFQTLPPELQAFIATVALLQKTGVLTIGFKAADIVKDLFASKVPVMNVGVLNAGVGGGGGGAPGGAAGKLGGGALAITAVGAVSVIGTQVLIDKADQWAPKAQAAYTKSPTINTGGGIATPDNFAVIEARKAMEGFVWVTDQASSSEAALTLRHKEQLAGLQGVIASANVGTQSLGTLGQSIRAAGEAAGLSAEQTDAMTSAAYRVPADASVDQLAQSIRDAGTAAGLSAEQTDILAASAYAVPGSANLPALKSAIDAAGQSGQWTTEQTNIMTQALFAIPEGANAAQAGEAIRIAGVKAGLTDEQIRGVTAAANSIPPNKGVNVTTNAPAETGKINALQAAINSLSGKTIDVGVKLSGSTGGGTGGSSTFSGATSGVGGWMEGQVASLAEKLAPSLMGVSGGAYAGPGSGVLGRPMGSYTVSSEFGPRNGAMHYGIDLAAPMGQGIFASAAGMVRQAGWNGGYGNFIAIDHGLGITTRYGHMSAILARAGQIVGQGNLIGQVGSTGDSTGPHLHFETLAGGNFVNPRNMVAFDSGGWLKPGWSAVYNGTGRPEPVLTDKQWKQISGGQASGPTINIVNNYPQAEPTSVTTSRAMRLLSTAGGL